MRFLTSLGSPLHTREAVGSKPAAAIRKRPAIRPLSHEVEAQALGRSTGYESTLYPFLPKNVPVAGDALARVELHSGRNPRSLVGCSVTLESISTSPPSSSGDAPRRPVRSRNTPRSRRRRAPRGWCPLHLRPTRRAGADLPPPSRPMCARVPGLGHR